MTTAGDKEQSKYVYNRPDIELDRMFYERYDENLLYAKALAIETNLNNEEQFKQQLEAHPDMDIPINERLFDALRAELHFTELHQFESFFALVLAACQDLPHWIYLSTYHQGEMKTAAELYLNDEIEKMSNGRLSTRREFVRDAIYCGLRPEGVEDSKWETNLDNVAWILERLAEKYASGQEYNAYKHGLRVMTGPTSFALAPNGPDGKPKGPLRVIAASQHSFVYLEFERLPDGRKRVYESTKHFNPDECATNIYIMHLLTTLVKHSRLRVLTMDPSPIDLPVFYNLDKSKLIGLREITKWRFTM